MRGRRQSSPPRSELATERRGAAGARLRAHAGNASGAGKTCRPPCSAGGAKPSLVDTQPLACVRWIWGEPLTRRSVGQGDFSQSVVYLCFRVKAEVLERSHGHSPSRAPAIRAGGIFERALSVAVPTELLDLIAKRAVEL